MTIRVLFAACVLVLVVGCGSSPPTGGSGKDIENQQTAEQHKADAEEHAENKARSTKGKKPK